MKKLIFILSAVLLIAGCNQSPNSQKQINDILCTAYDNTIYPSIEEKDAHNQTLIMERHATNENNVMDGKMNEMQQQEDEITFKRDVEVKDIDLKNIAALMQNGVPYEKAKMHMDSVESKIQSEVKNSTTKKVEDKMKRKMDSMIHIMRMDSIKAAKQ